MLNSVDFYYFSPTGGTKKVGEILVNLIASSIDFCDLASKRVSPENPKADLSIVAVPVFGGRIPSFVIDKLKNINGDGKKAITLVVYGNRAYEDALLELNNFVESLGFDIVASGAFIAQHSIVPEVGAGRPDENDVIDIKNFAKKIIDKIETGVERKIEVSGNFNKPDFSMPVAPISLQNCNLCRKCITVCPTYAISLDGNAIKTNVDNCIFCMACVRACLTSARIVPPPVQEKVSQMLAKFKDIRRDNEMFI